MEYYIYATNDCNLNCSYCSVQFNLDKFSIPKNPIYDIKQLKQFINRYQIITKDPVADIYFFGGEPTVNFDYIEEIIDTMSEASHEYKINYILHTNALLIDKMPQKIIDNLFLTIVSINYEKIYTNGVITEYFYKIMSSVNLLKQKKIKTIGRITVSPQTSLYTLCSLLGNFFDYIYWQMDNSEDIGEFSLYKQKYCEEISLLFNYWMSFFEKGLFLSYVPFMSAINNFLNDVEIPTEFYCGYGSSMIYIQTDGSCHACCDNVETKSHYIGDIYNGIRFPSVDFNKIICKKCEFIKICGGRCGRMHKDFSTEKINEYCELNKFTFNLIKSNLQRIKEVLKKYPLMKKALNDKMVQYTEYTS